MGKNGITISVPNQKGGVAKTTVAVNTAATAASLGHKVLLVDFDYQGNATASLGKKREAMTSGKNVTSGLIRQNRSASECITVTDFKNLSLIASDLDFCEFHHGKSSVPGSHLLLREWLDPIRGEYDYIFIDVHPDLQLPFQNAMVASNYYLIPLFAEPDAVDGLHLMFKHLSMIQERLNPTLYLLGCVISKVNKRNATHNKYVELIGEFSSKHGMPILGEIRESTAVQGASDLQKPLLYYKPRLSIVSDFQALTENILSTAKPNRRGRTPRTPTVTKSHVLEFLEAGSTHYEEAEEIF